MFEVIIESIGDQYVLEDADFEFIRQHIGKPLPIVTMWQMPDGRLCSFSVRDDKADIITLFLNPNKLSFTLKYKGRELLHAKYNGG